MAYEVDYELTDDENVHRVWTAASTRRSRSNRATSLNRTVTAYPPESIFP